MSKEAINAALDKKAENAKSLGLDYEPPHRLWVGLTDEEIESIAKEYQSRLATALMIEAKLKEKNNG